jgi:hypothetical protein
VGEDTPFFWLKGFEKGGDMQQKGYFEALADEARSDRARLLAKERGTMTVYVVVGVWSGCINEVTAWSDKDKAKQEAERMRNDYGIIAGQEAESDHAVDWYELEVK